MKRTLFLAALAAVALSACSTPAYAQTTDVPLGAYSVAWSFHSTGDTYGLTPVKQRFYEFSRPSLNLSLGAQFGPVVGTNLTLGSPAAGYQVSAVLRWEPEPFYLFAGLQATALVEQGRQGVSGKAGLTAGFGYRF